MILHPHVGTWPSTNAFNIASLPFDGFWEDYPGSLPWSPTASAGGSGSNGNLVAGVAPSAGPTQGGKTIALLNGTTQFAQTANAPGTYISLGSGFACVLGYVLSAPATSGTSYTDPCLFGNAGSVEFEMTFASYTGTPSYVVHYYDGSHHDTNPIAFSLNTWLLFWVKWDSVNVTAGIGATTATPVGAGAIDTFAAQPAMQVGTNYNGTVFGNFRAAMIGASKTAFSSTQITNLRSGCSSRWGVSV